MAVKQTKKMQAKVLEALQRRELAVDADENERKLAIDDVVFANAEDGQWDDLAKKRRRNKPRYTINQVAAAVNEVNGNYRQNQIEIKARPEQDTDKEEADIYNGLIRAILSTQDAKLAQKTSFKMIATGGFSAFRVLNATSEFNPFEQDIGITPIYEAMETVWFDPAAKHPTGKDGSWVFEEEMVARKEFEARWPDAMIRTWPDAAIAKMQKGWGLGGNKNAVIRVADYYVKEPVTVDQVLLSDGSIIDADDYQEVVDELAEKDITLVDSKPVETFKVMHYKMSGAEVLEKPVEVPSMYLPIIRCLGYWEWMDGTLHYRGIVRAAKDPQRVYNYATSANIEATALKPKDKVMATRKMIGNEVSSWQNMNNTESSVLIYNPDDESPDRKPVPLVMGQGTPELIQQAQQAQLDLQSTIGRRAPAQGESPSDRSGRAILALQKQDDSVTFELLDNLAISWEHAAAVVIDMLPKVIDTERQVQILGPDNEELIATLNETVEDSETGKEVIKNDTSKRYRIKASVGPAFETKRTEAVNVLSTLSQNPQYGPLIPDMLTKALDFPFADELSTRFRRNMLQQGLVEPNDEEKEEALIASQTPEGQQQAALQQQIQQMQMQGQMLQLEKIRLENANLEANIANLQAATMEKFNNGAKSNADISETYVDVYTKQVDTMIKQIDAGVIPTNEQLSTIQGSLQLLDATQQQEFTQRIQQALNQAQQLQPQV